MLGGSNDGQLWVNKMEGEKVPHAHYLGGLGKCCVGAPMLHIYTKG
jgi:hypothetical protein